MNFSEEAKKMGIRLRSLREQKSLTTDGAAKEIGIGVSTLNGYERGSTIPTLFSAKQVADYYGVSLDYLVGTIDETTHKQTDIEAATGIGGKALSNLMAMVPAAKSYNYTQFALDDEKSCFALTSRAAMFAIDNLLASPEGVLVLSDIGNYLTIIDFDEAIPPDSPTLVPMRIGGMDINAELTFEVFLRVLMDRIQKNLLDLKNLIHEGENVPEQRKGDPNAPQD